MRYIIIITLFLFCFKGAKSQEITMFNGFGVRFYQDDKRISAKEADALLLGNRFSRELWRKAKNQRKWSYFALAGEVGFVGWSVFRAFEFKNPWPTYWVSIASAAASLRFTSNSNRMKREAILAYNKSFDQ